MRDGRWRRTASGVLALGLLLTGCGDGNSPEGTASPTPPSVSTDSTGAPPGGSTPAPAPATTPSAAPAPATRASETVYVVREGDNLTAIADRFGTTVEAIVQANDLEDPNLILVGQELTIPPSS